MTINIEGKAAPHKSNKPIQSDAQQRINTPLSLRASPHLLPQSLQQMLFIRSR